MHNLSKRLADVPGIGHVIYADDITIWSAEGPLGKLEGNLQRALDVTVDFLASTGLQLSPSKSELLLHKRFPRRGPEIDGASICLRSKSGKTIPICDSIKVLGMTIGKYSNNNTEALRRIEKSTHSFTRVISRVANKRKGLKEDNLMKAFHAFLIRHIIYAAPFLKLKKMELNKLMPLSGQGLNGFLIFQKAPTRSGYCSSDCTTQQRSSLKLNEPLKFADCPSQKQAPGSSWRQGCNPCSCPPRKTRSPRR